MSKGRFSGLQDGDIEDDVSSPPVQAFDLDGESSKGQSNIIDSGGNAHPADVDISIPQGSLSTRMPSSGSDAMRSDAGTNPKDIATNVDSIPQETSTRRPSTEDVATAHSCNTQNIDEEKESNGQSHTASEASIELDITLSDVPSPKIQSNDVTVIHSKPIGDSTSNASNASISILFNTQQNTTEKSSATNDNDQTKSVSSKKKSPEHSSLLPQRSSSSRLEHFAFTKSKNSSDKTTAANVYNDLTARTVSKDQRELRTLKNTKETLSNKVVILNRVTSS